MDVTYHGLSCVRLRGRDALVAIDPPDKLSSLGRMPDLIVRTSGPTVVDLLRQRDGQPQEVGGSGEFELRGVSVVGIPVDDGTVMCVEIDDVRVVALGTLSRQLTEDEVDRIGQVDVLVVPVGGKDALGASDATKVVNAIEPAVVVPVRYQQGSDGDFEPVDRFAKEMAVADGWTAQPKLALTGSMASSEDTRVVILEPKGTS